MIKRLLYLTYIPLEEDPSSGSAVRPLKMKEALENQDIEVRTFGGISNDLSLRRRTLTRIKGLLNDWKPDACYIEPPSGPFFYFGDVMLIKKLHRMGVPTSLFYRDAYWKYPEYSEENELSLVQRVKRFIVKGMQIHQWNVFRKNIDLLYFPSKTMAREFECPHKDTLPPGGFVADVEEKKKLSDPLQCIFVGGAARNHGTQLTIASFAALNESGIRAKLIYVCPEDQWTRVAIDTKSYRDWLEVVHTSGDQNLKPLYERADIAILTAPRSFYRDFAVPIKLFEYMSYLKPMLVTDCTETARVVEENRVGWITKDDVASIVAKLEELCDHPQEIISVREHMKEAREKNLWDCRAKKVIRDLEQIRKQ